MSRNRTIPAIACLAAMLALSGCADYLNRFDTVTLAAGDAQKQNLLAQTEDPFNPDSKNTKINTDGVLVGNAVKRHLLPKPVTDTTAPNITVNLGTQSP